MSVVRLYRPAAALKAQGADVVLSTSVPRMWWRGFPLERRIPPRSARPIRLAESVDADVLVISRPTQPWHVGFIRLVQSAGVRVVVDVDDTYNALERWAYSPYPEDRERALEDARIISTCCAMADVVTISTEPLLDEYGRGHGVVLPNLVPEEYLDIEPAERSHSVGWTGTVIGHPDDLESTGGAVADVLSRVPGWHFRLVGPPDHVAAALGLTWPFCALGYVPLSEYPQWMAEIGVGVVPLARSRFNAAKSALKMSEFAALGVPVVASPTPDNRRLHALGVGELAGGPDQWRRHLCRLLQSADARAELAGRGREVMAGQTYELHCGRWWEAWTA